MLTRQHTETFQVTGAEVVGELIQCINDHSRSHDASKI